MRIRKQSVRAASGQHGMVLIEALIAVFLFSIGILALVGLQATMTKNVTHAKLRGEASYLANQLIGQMWVDQGNLSSYAIANGTCAAGGYAKCVNWGTMVSQALPNGTADVVVSGTAVNITLAWRLPGEEVARYRIDANVTN